MLLPQEFATQKHRRKPESLELKTFGQTLNFYFFRRCCFTVFLLYHFLQESAIILIFVPLRNLSLFSGCFEDFSLSLVLSSFILMCPCVHVSYACGIHWAFFLDLWVYVFIRFGKILGIIFQFFLFLLPVLCFEGSNPMRVRPWKVVPQFTDAPLFDCLSCVSFVWIVHTVSSHSLIFVLQCLICCWSCLV